MNVKNIKRISGMSVLLRVISLVAAISLAGAAGCSPHIGEASSHELSGGQGSFPGKSEPSAYVEPSSPDAEGESSSSEVVTEEIACELAKTAAISEDYSGLIDGDIYSGIVFHSGTAAFSMEWSEPVDIDRVISREAGEAIDSISITALDKAGNILTEYTQDECGPERVSAITQHGVSRLDFNYHASSGEFSLTEIEVCGEKPGSSAEFSASAYIPVGDNNELDKQRFSDALRELDDVMLITGCSWNADNRVVVSDEFVYSLEQIKKSLPSKASVWATIYPSYKLINKGTAGATVETAEKRAALIDSLLYFADEHELDGLDFDWEFPGNEKVWADLSALIVELKQRRSSLKLSAALYPDKALLSDEAFSALDRVNVMTYDQFDSRGYHSTYKTVTEAINNIPYFVNNHCEVNKLYIGIPAYGRPIDASNIWNLYNSIAISDKYSNKWKHTYFNSCAMAADKTAYAMQSGFGGVFLFHLKCDRTFGDEYSLLGSILDYIRFK